MEPSLLEYSVRNVTEFLVDAGAGILIGYTTTRIGAERYFPGKPQMSKLGWATLASFNIDAISLIPSDLGLSSKTIMEAAQGDIGSILGFYVGFNIGKVIDIGLSKIYRNRNLETTIHESSQ